MASVADYGLDIEIPVRSRNGHHEGPNHGQVLVWNSLQIQVIYPIIPQDTHRTRVGIESDMSFIPCI